MGFLISIHQQMAASSTMDGYNITPKFLNRESDPKLKMRLRCNMPESDWVYVGHMLDMCQTGLEISAGKTRQDYGESETLQFALAHILTLIGSYASWAVPKRDVL
jgi:hypothetical protein